MSDEPKNPVPTSVATMPPETTLFDSPVVPAYVHTFQIAVDTSGVVIMFRNQRFLGEVPNGLVGNQEVIAAVALSHINAKDLFNLLKESLGEFEKTVAPIPDVGRFAK